MAANARPHALEFPLGNKTAFWGGYTHVLAWGLSAFWGNWFRSSFHGPHRLYEASLEAPW